VRRDHLAGSLRQLADKARHAFPETAAHQHIADAARALNDGNNEGAARHLNAAIAMFTPQNISRHGLGDDTAHIAAKRLMGEAHRHLLLVKDASATPEPAALANRQRGIELARKAVGL
jgi:hypothetical protein